MANLTTAQQATLKTDINSRAGLTAAVTAMDWPTVAAFYNGASNPVVHVWNPFVPMNIIKQSVAWNSFIGLSVGQQNTYQALMLGGYVDMTEKNQAKGLVGLTGATGVGVFDWGSASSNNIVAASNRIGTVLEALFSAAGTSTLASANICQLDAGGQSIYGQQLDPGTVQRAMGF